MADFDHEAAADFWAQMAVTLGKLDKEIDANWDNGEDEIATALGVKDDLDTYSMKLAAEKMAKHHKDLISN